MKKTISFVLLLALCLSLFAGCTFPFGPQTATNPDLESAKTIVFNAYKPAKKGEVPAKSADFELMTSVMVDGKSFPVAWSLEVTSGPADAVKLVNGSKVDLTEKPDVEILFTLTAVISDSEGNSTNVSFNFKTPAFEAPIAGNKVVIKNVADAVYATGAEYQYVSSSGTKKMELPLSENKAEALAFTMLNNADGSVTFKTDCGKFLFCDATNVELVDTESDNTKFILEVADGGYYIKCAYANYNGKAQYLEVYSGYLTCYGMNDSKAGLYIFALEDGTGANGTVTDFVEGGSDVPPATEPPAAQLPEVSAPAADTAYKFGLVQVTNGTTVYVTGAVSGRYLATTTDKAAAADVYVEAADNGYKFYIMVDGAKNYIYIYNNDEGKRSVAYSATEANIFTYNAAISTWATSFEGTDCYLGSYNNFETISVSNLSYINAENAGITQFPAGFFSVEGGNTDVPPTTEPVTPPVTEPSTSTSASLSFADVANRTSVSEESQVWEQNGIKFTNDKAESTQPINGNYTNPVRVYANTSVKIEYKGMLKIVFDMDTGKPVKNLTDSVTVGGTVASCTADGSVVTIIFSEAVDSFEIAKVLAQFRVKTITVYA